MINGKVTSNREAVIELEVAGPAQQLRRMEAVIDTGYTGDLTLPHQLVAILRLPFAGYHRGTLADGSTVLLDAFLATVHWQGKQQDVIVSQAVGVPLVGMSLLWGSRLSMDISDGGDVEIQELPRNP